MFYANLEIEILVRVRCRMKQTALAAATKILKAAGNLKRLEILFILRDKELHVGQLQKMVDLSQSALSQHLAILREENIVKTRREAQVIFYSICDSKIVRLLGLLEDMYAAV